MKEGKIVFSTVFTDMENIHLIKDPGMIPYIMQKEFGYYSIVPISSIKNYPYLDNFYSEIETPVIHDKENRTYRNYIRILWIIKNAKIIDILNIYFFDKWTWYDIFFYKLFNKKGLVYVHCDTDGQRLIDFKFTHKYIELIIQKIILNDKILNDVLWGIQNSNNIKYLNGKWPYKNIKFVPNGVCWEKNVLVQAKDKKNIILTVGRIGSPEKRTDLLLKCFKVISEEFKEWRLRLVGPLEKKFEPFLENFFSENPQMRSRIDIVGAIYDRNVLEMEYVKAKIFCLPSAYESFGLVAVEALSKGDFIIGSDIASNIEITNKEDFGLLFKNGNLDDFIDKLRYILSNEDLINLNVSRAMTYAEEHYSWKNALSSVYSWISEKIEHGKN